MNPKLTAFLTAEDLDDVLRARQAIEFLDSQDTATVRLVIDQWQDHQAVSTLIFHADVLPDDVRFTLLFRAMAEREIAYFILAAIVGFQAIDPEKLYAENRNKIATSLWDMIGQTDGVIAERASVSLRAFVAEPEIGPMFFLLDHDNKTVRHNIRVWLFAMFKDRGVEAFTKAAVESKISPEAERQITEEFKAFVTEPPQGFKSPLFLLYSCLPNLREIS